MTQEPQASSTPPKKPTIEFFHGSPAGFDEFDQARINTTGGSAGQIQHGRGHYAVAQDMAHAGKWITDTSRHGGVIYRFEIEEDVFKNPQRFIAHDHQYNAYNIEYMANVAAESGYNGISEKLHDLNKAKNGKVTGADIANLTKYDENAAHFLRHQGYIGFTFDYEKGSGAIVKNAVFLNAGDIPATTPIVTPQYVNEVVKNGQQVDASRVPPELSRATNQFLERIEQNGKKLGLSDREITATKERVTALSQAAAGMDGYDGKSQLHPLKLTESALVSNIMDRRLADSMRAETAQFVETGMKSLKHLPRPTVLTEALADSNRYDLGYRNKGEVGYTAPEKDSQRPHHQRGMVRPGMAGGLAATALFAAGAFQEAKAAGAPVPDQIKAAAKAAFPTASALAENRKAEAAAQIIDRIDPTMGVISGGVRGGMRAVGLDVDEGMLQSTRKQAAGPVITAQKVNDRINREQDFLLHPDHPDQLSALKIKEKTGQDIDVATALRDPSRRSLVFDDIARRSQNTQNPDVKEMLDRMKDAATQFVDLESRRKPAPLMPADPAPQTQPTITPGMT